MNNSVEEATKFYLTLPSALRLPSYHPLYIVADACRDKSIEPHFFTFERNGDRYYHGLHVAPVLGTRYLDIQSPYGYGGPISSTRNKEFLAVAWQQYCDWCRERDIIAEFIRFHPVLKNETIYGGSTCYNRETVWIDLQQSDLLQSYSARMRTTIRKAIKSGLVVEWLGKREFLEVFLDLYRDLMCALQADSFYLFPEQYFTALLDVPGIRLAVCKCRGEVIAGAVFLVDQQGMEYHLSAANLLGKTMSATSLIFHVAALLGKELGCRVLHLGGGTDGTVDNPLLYFKTKFSKNKGVFKIGYHIHKQEIYNQLKHQWSIEHGESNKILFYRC